MARPDGRAPDELRPVTLTRNWSIHPEGAVLVEFGRCCGIVSQADIALQGPRKKTAEVVRELSEPTVSASAVGEPPFVEAKH